MNKSDLKAGYLVRYRNGCLRMVMPTNNQLVFVNEDGVWAGTNDYDEQLKCRVGKEYDIIEVWGFSEFPTTSFIIETTDRKLLSKENEKEMTISEIEKELGYPIKIIKEN